MNKVIKNNIAKTRSQIDTERKAISSKFQDKGGYVDQLKSIDTNLETIRIDLRKLVFPHFQSVAKFEETLNSNTKTKIKSDKEKPLFEISRMTSYIYELSGEIKSDHTGERKSQFGRIVESVVKECLLLNESNNLESDYAGLISVASKDSENRYCSSPKFNKDKKQWDFKNDKISYVKKDCLLIEHHKLVDSWNKKNPETQAFELVPNNQDTQIKCSMEIIATQYRKVFGKKTITETDYSSEVMEQLNQIYDTLELVYTNEQSLALMNTAQPLIKKWHAIKTKVNSIDNAKAVILEKDSDDYEMPIKPQVKETELGIFKETKKAINK